MMYHIRLALAFKKNVYILPNSIGPLKNPISKWLTVKTLKQCKLVSVRENISLDFVRSLGVEACYYPDFGFYLKPSKRDFSSYLTIHGVPLDKKKVVMTMRPNRFTGMQNAAQLYRNYLIGIAELVKYLVGTDYHVTFFAHTLGPSSHEDDRIAIKDVKELLDDNILSSTSYIEDFDLTCEDVEKIYSYYDYMIGTRFHSVIFSLNSGVPAIAIAYGGNKGKGIMNVLENDRFSIDMDKINRNSLITLFVKLAKERDAYLSNLKEKRLIIDSMRSECLDTIKKYERID